MIATQSVNNGQPVLVRVQSTSHTYQASPEFKESLPADAWPVNGRLNEQSEENPDQVDPEDVIQKMEKVKEIRID